ncbi:MAG: pitrilysin family protein [Alphaproteobacteria bacterium]|nr:pitrilysin family protein [Alphaproteobacteria bacterium]
MIKFVTYFLFVFFNINAVFSNSAEMKLPIKVVPILTKNQAWLIEDPSTPLVLIEMTFTKTGSSYMPIGKEGLSTLFSNLFLKARNGGNHHEFIAIMDGLKLKVNTNVSHDNLGFSFSFPKENADKVIPLIKTLFNNAVFSEEDVNKNKYGGYTNFAHSNPSYVAQRALHMKVFQGHPYGQNPDGDSQSIQMLRADDIKIFPQAFLAKENLKISFLGSLNEKETQNYANQILQTLPDEKLIKTDDIPYIEPKPVKDLTQIYQDVPQSSIAFIYPMPKYNTLDYYYATIANVSLGLTQESKLWRAARVKKGLVYGISTDIEQWPASTYLYGSASTQGAQTQQILDIVRQKFTNLKTKGISEKDLSFAQNHLTGKIATALIEPRQIINLIHYAQTWNKDIDFLQKYVDAIRSVKLEDVNKFIQNWIDPQKLSFAIVGKNAGCEIPQE